MFDRVLQGIEFGSITSSNIRASRLIEDYREQHIGAKIALDFGRAVIQTPAHLDQYLWSYGRMVKVQWSIVKKSEIFTDLQHCDSRLEVVDVGCGQGLSSAFLLEMLSKSRVTAVHLFDPGAVALRRARCVVSLYGPKVRAFNLRAEEIRGSHLDFSETKRVVVLSNILDLPGIDVDRLRRVLFEKRGDYVVLVVSPDREFDGGNPQILKFYNSLKQFAQFRAAEPSRWKFSPSGGQEMSAITFACDFQI
jgi:SAM-dependent methyltransferase